MNSLSKQQYLSFVVNVDLKTSGVEMIYFLKRASPNALETSKMPCTRPSLRENKIVQIYRENYK